MSGLLLRGLLAGFVAGLLAFGFAKVFGEPSVSSAVAFEAHEHAHSHGAAANAPAELAEELVTRSTQAGLGLLTGILTYSTALGGLYAIAFAFVHGRVLEAEPRRTAAWLALGGFIAVYLVPWLKYPANPPSVGAAETIGYRTELYFIMVLVSVLAAALGTALAHMSVARLGSDNAAVAGFGAFVCIVGLWSLYLPAIDEVPSEFSASLLWDFRLASLYIQAALWTSLAIVFGLLAERSPLRPAGRRRLHRLAAFR